jgi:hypothetical protein
MHTCITYICMNSKAIFHRRITSTAHCLDTLNKIDLWILTINTCSWFRIFHRLPTDLLRCDV